MLESVDIRDNLRNGSMYLLEIYTEYIRVNKVDLQPIFHPRSYYFNLYRSVKDHPISSEENREKFINCRAAYV